MNGRLLACFFAVPAPCIPEPDMWNDVQGSRLRTTIPGNNTEEQLVFIFLCGFNEDVPISIVIKDARIDKLILPVSFAAFGVFSDEILVGELALRVLVEIFHVGMRRRVVEVEVSFFDALPVIPLWVREAEQSFF